MQKKGVGRNDRCPCDSGKKYKKCCGDMENKANRGLQAKQITKSAEDSLNKLTNMISQVMRAGLQEKNKEAIESLEKNLDGSLLQFKKKMEKAQKKLERDLEEEAKAEEKQSSKEKKTKDSSS